MNRDASESMPNPVADLLDEFIERCRRGEAPLVTEYTQKYPDHADEIRDVFGALGLVEGLKPNTRDIDTLASWNKEGEAIGFPEIDDFRIIREIGRGGMGVVYEAEQIALGRRVALKVLPSGLHADATSVQRFQQEARAAAAMHHSNIVPVFEVGSVNGLHFYAMQFIVGDGLDRVIEVLREMRDDDQANRNGRRTLDPASNEVSRIVAGALTTDWDVQGKPQFRTSISPVPNENDRTPDRGTGKQAKVDTVKIASATSNISSLATPQVFARNVARIGTEVAAALEHAHRRNVIHRDIKPSNILLDTESRAWVADFGLAKSENMELTQTGNILGTLRYMAPERFSGPCDARGDVYGLGATLYELLTLQPLFTAGDHLALIGCIKTQDPKPIRELDRTIPLDLETIVHKAIAKEPARRYQTAAQLEDDLQRFLDGRPIQARRVGPLERLSLWANNNRMVAGLAASLMIGLFAVAVGSTWGALQYRLVARQAEAKADEAMAINEFLNRDILGAGNPSGAFVDRNTPILQVLAAAADKLQGRFAGRPIVLSQVQRTLGEAYVGLGEFETAKPLLTAAYEQLRQELGPQHAETATAALHLGQLLLESQEDVALSQSLLESAYAYRLSEFGPNDPATIEAEFELANHALVAAENEKAVKRLTAVWERSKRVFGETHRETIKSLIVLAKAHLQTELATAEPYLAEALQVAETELGEQDLLTLNARQNLATYFIMQVQPQSAESLIEENLAAAEKWLGPNHPRTLKILADLHGIYLTRNDYERRIATLRDLIGRTELTYGSDAPLVIESWQQLAWALTETQQLVEAEEIANRTLALATDRQGAQSPIATGSLLLLGKIDDLQGNFDDAERRLGQAYQQFLDELGSEHESTYGSRWVLINHYVRRQMFNRAKPLMEEALVAVEKLRGENHMQTAEALRNLSFVYGKLEEIESEERVLRRAIQIVEQQPNSEQLHETQLQLAKLKLAGCVARQERYDEALAIIEEAVQFDNWIEREYWNRWESMGIKGGILAKMGELKQAEAILLESHAGFFGDSLDHLDDILRRRFRMGSVRRLIQFYEQTEQADALQRWQERLAELEKEQEAATNPQKSAAT